MGRSAGHYFHIVQKESGKKDELVVLRRDQALKLWDEPKKVFESANFFLFLASHDFSALIF